MNRRLHLVIVIVRPSLLLRLARRTKLTVHDVAIIFPFGKRVCIKSAAATCALVVVCGHL
jgi:hypothetical protein